MKRKTPDDLVHDKLMPSRLVRRFAAKIADVAAGKPVLDVACGSGRNALALARLGCTVICMDRDLTTLKAHVGRPRGTELRKSFSKLSLHQLDLVKDPWPFTASVAGAIINVHFLLSQLFPFFERSLST